MNITATSDSTLQPRPADQTIKLKPFEKRMISDLNEMVQAYKLGKDASESDIELAASVNYPKFLKAYIENRGAFSKLYNKEKRNGKSDFQITLIFFERAVKLLNTESNSI